MLKHFAQIDRRIDYTLILPVFCLLGIGLVALYTAVRADYPDKLFSILLQQGMWILLGILVSFLVMFFSTKHLWRLTPALYLLGLILMLLPLYFYSPALYAATGSKNWVTINGLTLFQPSEFMKISYILSLAYATIQFERHLASRLRFRDLGLLGLYLLISLPPLLLLALQKDLGTSLVFVAILMGMVFIAGLSWRMILSALALLSAAFMGFMALFLSENGQDILFDLGMDAYQINRISAWLYPFDYAKTIAYQQTQGMISISRGGLLGAGFGQVGLSVPVRESDMIFTVIAENFGFIGATTVLCLYLFLIYRMLRITLASNNRFYAYIAIGFIMMLLFHSFENIGAALGLLPLTGIPLPFISQGGSAMISNLIGVGLVLSMAYQRRLELEKRFDTE